MHWCKSCYSTLFAIANYAFMSYKRFDNFLGSCTLWYYKHFCVLINCSKRKKIWFFCDLPHSCFLCLNKFSINKQNYSFFTNFALYVSYFSRSMSNAVDYSLFWSPQNFSKSMAFVTKQNQNKLLVNQRKLSFVKQRKIMFLNQWLLQ